MNNADLNILLVDDHAVVRAGYRHLLETQGGFKQVREAENAQEAYAACQKDLPALVICDISMPEPVGLNLVQRVLGRWPEVKFLMFTMHNSIELARACMDAGAKRLCHQKQPARSAVARHWRSVGGPHFHEC